MAAGGANENAGVAVGATGVGVSATGALAAGAANREGVDAGWAALKNVGGAAPNRFGLLASLVASAVFSTAPSRTLEDSPCEGPVVMIEGIWGATAFSSGAFSVLAEGGTRENVAGNCTVDFFRYAEFAKNLGTEEPVLLSPSAT